MLAFGQGVLSHIHWKFLHGYNLGLVLTACKYMIVPMNLSLVRAVCSGVQVEHLGF